MDENNNIESQQNIQSEEVEQQTQTAEEQNKPNKKGIKALIEYINSKEDLRQMVLFVLFSMCCAAAQVVTQFVLKYAIGAFNQDSFNWFIFTDYDKPKGLAEFIGFACGAIIGQVMTFILNRKKTFKATNNVIVSGVMYAIIAVGIIILQTYLGGVVTGACKDAAIKNGTTTEGFIGLLITLTGMAVGGLVAMVLSFLGNKYLVMRDWGKKKSKAEAQE